MTKTYITSDIHFSHRRIMEFCPDSRPFKDVEEMDQKIIEIWNSMINPEDLTYILGDVAFCNAEKASKLVNRLNGRKVLIRGNHDSKTSKDQRFLDCFENVRDYLRFVHNGHLIVLFHYPIFEWDQMHRGSIHFHGHLHARPTGIDGRIFDVAMDGNNCIPYNMDDLIQEMLKKPIRIHGDGE